MAIDINVPSQVKTYANLAAFPATGSLKTIFIAEDTNKTYRWTGSVYVEVSAAGATGITIGTTAIASGTVGRVLFEGTGNVVQESANLFWDNTNGRLGVAQSTPTARIHIQGSSSATSSSSLVLFNSTPTEIFRVRDNGNVQIGTTTDAGFKLDVNGTARVSGGVTSGIIGTAGILNLNRSSDGANVGFVRAESSGAGIQIGSGVNMFFSNNGRIVVNSITTDASAIFKIDSTNQGFLPPRMTTTQKNAIATPAAGLLVYDSTLNKLCVRTASAWETITSL